MTEALLKRPVKGPQATLSHEIDELCGDVKLASWAAQLNITKTLDPPLELGPSQIASLVRSVVGAFQQNHGLDFVRKFVESLVSDDETEIPPIDNTVTENDSCCKHQDSPVADKPVPNSDEDTLNPAKANTETPNCSIDEESHEVCLSYEDLECNADGECILPEGYATEDEEEDEEMMELATSTKQTGDAQMSHDVGKSVMAITRQTSDAMISNDPGGLANTLLVERFVDIGLLCRPTGWLPQIYAAHLSKAQIAQILQGEPPRKTCGLRAGPTRTVRLCTNELDAFLHAAGLRSEIAYATEVILRKEIRNHSFCRIIMGRVALMKFYVPSALAQHELELHLSGKVIKAIGHLLQAVGRTVPGMFSLESSASRAPSSAVKAPPPPLLSAASLAGMHQVTRDYSQDKIPSLIGSRKRSSSSERGYSGERSRKRRS